jgi:aldehyde:ferredoxin oxidoreductase
MDEEHLKAVGERSRNLYRAILIRNHGRTRQMEVDEILPILSYPDPWGETCEADEWNELVDNYYRVRGWDQATGWPTRETYEKWGLADVADELETTGKLPKLGYEPPEAREVSAGSMAS